MPSYRINRAGEVEIPASRWKTAAMLVLTTGFTAACVWAVSDDAGPGWAWLGLALFGGGGAFFAFRQLRLGLLRGKPALVLGPDGLWDRVTGFRVGWDEIEGLELWEMSVRGSTQHWLGLWVRDPDAVSEQIGGLRGALNELVLPGRPPVNVSLNLLAVSPAEVAGLLRRFWHGPISGEPVAAAGPRRSRLRRFLGWLGAWVLTPAVAAVVLVVLIVVAESC